MVHHVFAGRKEGSRGRGFDPLLMDDDGGMLRLRLATARGKEATMVRSMLREEKMDRRTHPNDVYTAARFLYAHCRECDGDWAHRARICASTCRGRR